MNHLENFQHIDYIAFSGKVARPRVVEWVESGVPVHQAIVRSVFQVAPEFAHILYSEKLTIRGSKNFYENSIFYEACGAFMCWGGNNGTFYMELPGTACKLLREVGRANVKPHTETVLFYDEGLKFSRIDLAADFYCEDDPQDLVQFVNPAKVTSRDTVRRLSGNSEYFGSVNSEKQLTIYRWSPPHPRAPYLRWEFRIRHEASHELAMALKTVGRQQIFKGFVEDFGITWSPILSISGLESSHHLAYKKKQGGGRMRWLYGQCIPALRKDLDEGNITAAEVRKLLFDEEPKPYYIIEPENE